MKFSHLDSDLQETIAAASVYIVLGDGPEP
jgi:hypothetical protein